MEKPFILVYHIHDHIDNGGGTWVKRYQTKKNLENDIEALSKRKNKNITFEMAGKLENEFKINRYGKD